MDSTSTADRGERGVKNLEKMPTSFMDGHTRFGDSSEELGST